MLSLLFLLVVPSLCATTKTVLGFSRKLNTCDSQDRPFQNATTKIAWSYNNDDPIDENSILQHQYRGTASVRFTGTDNSQIPIPNGTNYFEVRENGTQITFDDPVTGPTTAYWCTSHKIELGQKRHVIRVDPVIDPKYIGQVHHFIVYQCHGELTETDMAYHGSCFSDTTPENVKNCNEDTMVHVWAVGGTPFIYPERVGLPVGPNTTYFVLQTHYNNPTGIEIKDHSGVRFYYSDELREYEAGVAFMGHPTSSLFLLPPGMSSTNLTGYCGAQCTQKHWPQTGLQIIALGLHTHTTGKSIYLQQFRNGTELPPPLSEPYYDFNYQDFTSFSPYLTWLPGDEFKVTCVYDTTSRTAPTPMGLGTQEEMCLVYYIYYPRLPPANESCASANFTGIDNGMNWTDTVSFCARDDPFPNFEPMQAVPYQEPACIHENVTLNFTKGNIDLTRFQRSQYLDDAKNYKLYWTVDQENGIIDGAVEVNTTGWVGFGITSYGMIGADVFIGWVKDGEVHLADRMALAHALPPKDTYQDYFNVYGQEISTEQNMANGIKLTPRNVLGLIFSLFLGVSLLHETIS